MKCSVAVYKAVRTNGLEKMKIYRNIVVPLFSILPQEHELFYIYPTNSKHSGFV